MAVSQARRKANDKWDKENMAILTCKVKKEYAEQVKKRASDHGESVNAYIKRLIDQDIKADTPDQ